MEQLLQTHAEVGIALAGFASVVAALRRPLTVHTRQRFLSLLALAVIQIVGCLLPLWFAPRFNAAGFGWRVLSAVMLALLVMRLWWVIILPSRQLGIEVRAIMTPVIGRLVWIFGLGGCALLLVNIVGLPLRPGFDLYYAGLLSALLPGFALFADVATTDS